MIDRNQGSTSLSEVRNIVSGKLIVLRRDSMDSLNNFLQHSSAARTAGSIFFSFACSRVPATYKLQSSSASRISSLSPFATCFKTVFFPKGYDNDVLNDPFDTTERSVISPATSSNINESVSI